jgi:hypothetical protein
MDKDTFFSPESRAKEIAEHLGGAKRSGDGWMCRCPAHDDTTASLAIAPGDKVPIVYKCHAGCSQEAVRDALVRQGLLEPEIRREEGRGEVVEISEAQRKKQGRVPRISKTPDAIYRYFKTREQLCFEKWRFTLVNGEKEFEYRQPSERGGRKCKEQKGAEWRTDDCKELVYCQVKLDRLRGKVPVIICEGEKDCDRLNKELGDSYVAVTNDTGGANWNAHFAKHLHGCDIIIAEDRDDVGESRTERILQIGGFERCLGIFRFKEDEVKKGGDVSDWLDSGHSVSELVERLKSGLEPPPSSLPSFDGEKEEASRDDFIAVFKRVFGDVRRDLFTGSAMLKNEDGYWEPVLNHVERVRSECHELTRTSDKRYKAGACLDHLVWWTSSLKAQPIFEIPEWDGVDRLAKMAAALCLDQTHGIDNQAAYELIGEWMANLWRKWRDPAMTHSPSRSFILILQGPQKIGKDYWLRTLLGALGQWFSDFTVSSNERDNLLQVHEHACLNISEFDRTNRIESATIKDLITKFSSNVRAAYARESKFRVSRCSFVASVNPFDILRDSTGNSRYVILPLKGILRNYEFSHEFSQQCVAQGRYLADTGYVASRETWAKMDEMIQEATPDDALVEIEEWWRNAATQYVADQVRAGLDPHWDVVESRGWGTNADFEPVLKELGRVFSLPRRTVLMRLKACGVKRLVGSGAERKRALVFRSWFEED